MTYQQRSATSILSISLQTAMALICAGILAADVPAQAQTLTVLHSFTGGNDGKYPTAGLTMDRAGNFYGTTAYGGASDVGVVFRLSPAGSGWS